MANSSNGRGLLSYENLVHAVSGGCGAAFAMTTSFPLDTVRTRLQLIDYSRERSTLEMMMYIYKTEGLSGLYKGLLPVVESLYCSNFIYFYTFHGLKRLIVTNEQSVLKDLAFAMIADGLQRILQEEGIKSLWSGTLSSLILVSNPAIQFMAYEAVKRRLQRVYGFDGVSSLVVFLNGAIAKTLATIITYPIQLVQAKQRHGHSYEGLKADAGIIVFLLHILKKHGVKGLYRGMEAKVLQTVFTAALMFVFYEKISTFIFALFLSKKRLYS